jgi:hypothetical protein
MDGEALEHFVVGGLDAATPKIGTNAFVSPVSQSIRVP